MHRGHLGGGIGDPGEQDDVAVHGPDNSVVRRHAIELSRLADPGRWANIHQELDFIAGKPSLAIALEEPLIALYRKVSLLDVRERIIELLGSCCSASRSVQDFLADALLEAETTRSALQIIKLLAQCGSSVKAVQALSSAGEGPAETVRVREALAAKECVMKRLLAA